MPTAPHATPPSPMPSPGLHCRPLAHDPAAWPTVAAWMVAAWPAWYGPGGRGDALADLQAYGADEHRLPLGLVAWRDGQPVGFAALKVQAFLGRPEGQPWAGAAVVPPDLRRQGIGLALVQALHQRALAMGHPTVLCATATAVTLLQRAGWHWVETVQHDGQPLQVFSSAAGSGGGPAARP